MIFVDLETTGLEQPEILSLAIVAADGTVLLNTYLTPPTLRRWPEGEAVHGITPEFIFNGGFPTVEQLRPQVMQLLSEDPAVFYNAMYDCPLLEEAFDTGMMLFDAVCCMLRYAQFVGEPASKPYHTGGYRTWKLTEAATAAGFCWPDRPHQALTDAQACRHVWQWMEAKRQLQPVTEQRSF